MWVLRNREYGNLFLRTSPEDDEPVHPQGWAWCFRDNAYVFDDFTIAKLVRKAIYDKWPDVAIVRVRM